MAALQFTWMSQRLLKILDICEMQTSQTLSLWIFPWEIRFPSECHFPASSCPGSSSCAGSAAQGESLPEHLLLGGVKGLASRRTPVPKGKEIFFSGLLCVFPFLVSHSLIHLGTKSCWFQVSCLCRVNTDTCPATQAGILVSHFSLPVPAWEITGRASKEIQFVSLSAHLTSKKRAMCEQG